MIKRSIHDIRRLSEASRDRLEDEIRRWTRFGRWLLAALLIAGCASDSGTNETAPPELGEAYLAAMQQAELLASDGAAKDGFGWSAAISGDTAIVGASFTASSQGAAYVFARSGTTWAQQQKLLAMGGAANDNFGVSVAISGDTAIVGAPGKASKQGAAYVFVRSGATWTELQELLPMGGAAGDLFGGSVAMSGDTAVVGVAGRANFRGAADVFVRSGTTWSQQQELVPMGTRANSGGYFGSSVAVDMDTIVGGAVFASAAYVFGRSGTTWTQQQELIPSDTMLPVQFGSSVGVSGDHLVVGAVSKPPSVQGGAYVFVRSATPAWTEQEQLLPSGAAPGDGIGSSVAASGNTAVVGAEGKSSAQGAAYVFILTPSNAAACMSAAQCSSGFCVDGVCCATACDGPCESCNGASPGVCSPDKSKNDCGPYACGDSGCRTSCTTEADCASPSECDTKTNKCVPMAPGGCACSSPGLSPSPFAGALAAMLAFTLAFLRRRRM